MSISEIIRYVYVTLGVAFILTIPVLCIRLYITKGKFKNDSLKHERGTHCESA